jgi:hypothetical protein
VAPWYASRWFRLGIGVVVLAGAALVGWRLFRGRLADSPPASFQECASEVGITWKMNFLPFEQGETFKINLYDHGCGLAVGDFDSDGHDDIYFCNQLGRNALYRNNGDGTFEDVTEKAGVGLGDRVCVAATWVDYDNDGHLDLFVTSTRGGNVLFRNNGDGTFSDVTKKAGLTHVGHAQTAVFFDYDNDGHLDLLVTYTAEWTSAHYDKEQHYWVGKEQFGGVLLSPKEHNILYRNNGNGTFTDVTDKVGLKGRGWAGDAVPFDYDGDGYLDVFVTCMFGRCQLYRNLPDPKAPGGRRFVDVTLKTLGRTPWGATGATVLDFNNDGRLDLFVVDMHSDMWMGLDWEHSSLDAALQAEKKKFPYLYGPRVRSNPDLIQREKELGREVGFRHEELIFGNGLYRNDGGGKFTEVSDRAGLETFWPWGIATGDFDNDGDEDIFIPSGMGYPFYYWPNYLMHNQGDESFRDRASDWGIEPPRRGEFFPEKIEGRPAMRSSRCAAVADFDGDGRLDIVVNNFNDQPYFFRNRLPRKNYVAFRLRGTWSNRDAVGAVVRLYQGKKVMTRQVLSACGYLGQSSRTLHFGLGDQPLIDRVEITWPRGLRQRLDSVRANATHNLVEPEKPK